MVKMESLAGALFLLLLLSFTNLCVGDTSPDTVVFFKDGDTRVTNIPHDKEPTQSTLYAFNDPAFVCGLVDNKQFLAIISIAKWSTSSKTDYTAAVFREIHGNDYTDLGYAKALIQPSDVNSPYTFWGDVTAVMKDRKVYVLTTTWDPTQRENQKQMGNILRDPFMSVGTVENFPNPYGGFPAHIGEWRVQSIKDQLPITVHWTKGSNFIGGTGNGIVTTNGTIMFPIVMFKANEMLASTLYSIDDGHTWNIGGETEPGTNSGSLVGWNDGKILFTIASDDGYRKVFESNDMGITWKRSPIFFGVWGDNQHGNNNFGNQGSIITVPVDKINVLLFLHTLTEQRGALYFDNLQLWLSDGQRIMCLGTITHKKKEEENSGNSILGYVNEQLFVTQRMNPLGDGQQVTSGTQKDSSAIGVTPLPHFLKNVQTAVRNWRQLDKIYQSIDIPTNGLVGVLGNSKDKAVWTDMYNCVNATINHATSVDGGFRFDDKVGSGAKWPVETQGQNQVYIFTANAFTLTANITIHSTNEAEDISLIGASENADRTLVPIGLGYKKKDNKLYVMQNSRDQTDTEVSVNLEKEYEVAITFFNGQGAVYLDGVNIANKLRRIFIPVSIDHFFFGFTKLSSTKENGHSCTVKNVMLFSRALNESEIAQFGKIQISNDLEKQTETTTKENVLANPDGSFTDKFSSTPEKLQSVRDTNVEREKKILRTASSPKGTREKENRPTDLENTVTSAPENTNAAQSKEAKEESFAVQQNTIKIKKNDNKMPKSPQQLKNTVFQQDFGSDNGAAMQFSAVAGMCFFACSLIAMTVF